MYIVDYSPVNIPPLLRFGPILVPKFKILHREYRREHLYNSIRTAILLLAF